MTETWLELRSKLTTKRRRIGLSRPNYHLPSDTIDTLDFTFMAELVKSLELALLELPPASAS